MCILMSCISLNDRHNNCLKNVCFRLWRRHKAVLSWTQISVFKITKSTWKSSLEAAACLSRKSIFISSQLLCNTEERTANEKHVHRYITPYFIRAKRKYIHWYTHTVFLSLPISRLVKIKNTRISNVRNNFCGIHCLFHEVLNTMHEARDKKLMKYLYMWSYHTFNWRMSLNVSSVKLKAP